MGAGPAPRRAPRRQRRCRPCSCAACWAGTATATAVVRGARVVPDASRPACGACSAPAAAGRRSSTGCGGCSPSASRRRARRPRSTWSRPRTLYQTLYWIARTAAEPTPATDVLHVTAAGWSAVPALVHKALHGTPMVLTEHGVYVREAYLAAVRGGGVARQPLRRHAAGPRAGARGLRGRRRRLARHGRERVLGGGARASTRTRSTCSTTACSQPGRPDAAARQPGRRLRRAHRPAEGRAHHAAGRGGDAAPRARTRSSCTTGRSRRARRPTGAPATRCTSSSGSATASASWAARSDPNGVVRDADVVLMTSISEGLPMSILEAMGQGRPVVSTGVGGVPDVVRGCGVVTRARRRPRARHGGRDAAARARARRGSSASAATAGSGASSTRRRASTATASCCPRHGRGETAAMPARMSGMSAAQARARAGRAPARRGAARPRAAGHARGRGRARGVGGRARRSTRSTPAATLMAAHTRRARKPSTGPLPAPPPREGLAAEAVVLRAGGAGDRLLGRAAGGRARRRRGRARPARRAPADARAPVGAAQPLPRPPAGPRAAAPRRPRARGCAPSLLVGGPAVADGARAGTVAALLTLTWTGGTVLIRRRWSAAYAGASCIAPRRRCSPGCAALARARGHGRGDGRWRVVAARCERPPARPQPPGRTRRAVARRR